MMADEEFDGPAWCVLDGSDLLCRRCGARESAVLGRRLDFFLAQSAEFQKAHQDCEERELDLSTYRCGCGALLPVISGEARCESCKTGYAVAFMRERYGVECERIPAWKGGG